MSKRLSTLIASLLASSLSACATSVDLDTPTEHVLPLSGSPVVESYSDYSEPLRCLAAYARSQSYPAPRVAIGHISDLTGADDYLSGRRLTQGATLMAITATSEAGMRLVERFDLGVVQVELDYAQSGLLRDSPNVLRTVQRGQMEGADLYLVGGITEFNPNIRSSGTNAFANTSGDTGGAIGIGSSEYIVDVGIDLRLIDVRSTEVLSVRSLRKQVRGREVESGIYAFFDGSVLDIGGGQRALEPVQTAVRSMIDRAVFEFMAELYNLETGSCLNGEPARQVGESVGAERLMTSRFEPAQQAATSTALPPTSATQLPPAEGFALHLASHRTVWNVNRSWSEMRAGYADVLGGREGRVLRTELPDEGTVFRLLAGRWHSQAEAEQACLSIRRRGGDCSITAFAGVPILRS